MTADRRTVGFNFLEEPELPAPRVSEEQAEKILAEHYGLAGRAESLGSQQDRNFVVRSPDNAILGILKIANPAFNATELAAQEAAAEAMVAAEPDLRIAVAMPNVEGEKLTAVRGLTEDVAHVRLLRYLSGGTLLETGYLAPAAVAGLGEISARVSRALAEFTHPGLDRVLQWDLRYGAEVVDALLPHVRDAVLRTAIETTAREAWSRIDGLADRLPRQAVHLDLTDANVVVRRSRGGVVPDGVIDFGDLTDSWAVSELAITASCVLGHPGSDPTSVLPALRAFNSIRPLTEAEAEAVWPLLVLRTAVLLVSGAQQSALDPDNTYLTDQADEEWRMFDQATSLPIDVMTAVIKSELGMAAPADQVSGRLVHVDAGSVVTLDLSLASDVYDDGGWQRDTVEDEMACCALDDGADLIVTRRGQPILSRTPKLSQISPDVVPTGIFMWSAADIALSAPWDGELTDVAADRFTLRGANHRLRVSGVRMTTEPSRVSAGEPLAEIAARERVSIAMQPVGAPITPWYTSAELAPGWLALTCDPRPLLGLAPVDAADGTDLLTRRDASFAAVQEHYYRDPPQIERGWCNYLLSTAGRCYLDMVNNVTVLGHAHPRMAATAARQLRKLNTNSRFNYEAVVEFSERLATTLPDPLDTVFLVNSGSEASDLALRLAMAATGRRDVVAVREAYHGWTYGTDAVSTSVADNPNALATRPDWVHTVESPNSFRGKYRGAVAVRYADDAVREIEELVAAGRSPAAFICESVYGNAGGMALPDGYLRRVYAAVRADGGLAISDEVQVGYGRLGEWFWGFQQQGVVPDIVSVAKSTGNGYPLGAVITSRAVAEAFRSQGYFFSSTGGSPLSCAIGITVLDVLRDEGLQQNASRVGRYLKDRLLALRDKHPLIGTVHGMGLYLGVEMVRDLHSLEPATEETAAICDRMLELGVIIQPTGDHQNILKTKPPLCIDAEGADFYVDTLDRVLTEGW
ncbi:aminotransferase [Mycolicibacterium celeriflavum]|uniref:aminotransferase n=1 Tax=Mycolicibacterium celeriflavum TaxID=1249101 RepID=UPI003CEC8B87